jgi:L-ascorbate metabolism protein UlaG (beta-lactamase superfamily)
LPQYLSITDCGHVDYIFISHAHFDHLPGCDRLAKQTGAIVIANGEAINVLRKAGVDEKQLLPVAGGERVPLFSADVWKAASEGRGPIAAGPPGAPKLPDSSLAAASVHVWPSLHCLLPGKRSVRPLQMS